MEQCGVGIPGVGVEWSQEWGDELQKRITEKHLSDETYLTQVANVRERPTVVVCDRGILDGGAYVEGGREAFLKQFGLKLDQCLALYDQIIHLNSLANDDPEKYLELLKTNPSRTEAPEQAQELDKKVFDAYEGHPKHIRVSAEEGIEAKIEVVLNAVRKELDRLKQELETETRAETRPIIRT